MSDVAKEIEDMINDLTPKSASPSEEIPEETPAEPSEPPKEEVKEEAPTPPAEEPAAKGDVVEEVVDGAAPVVETPATPSEDPRIAQMQKTINEMAQQLLGVSGKPDQSPQPKPEASQPPQPQVDLDLNNFQVLPEGVDFEDVVNDKATFEKWARDLLGRYEVSRVRRDALTAPVMVSRQVQYYLGLNEAIRSFYDTNKDLVQVKPLVGALANKIVAEHPDWTLPQIMEESAKAARAALGGVLQNVNPPVVPTEQPKGKVAPSFATPSGSRKPASQATTSKVQKEISDLLDGI